LLVGTRLRRVALSLALCAAPLVAAAQAPGTAQIGYLSTGGPSPLRRVFEDALRERGWVAGKNLVIEYRYAEEKSERLPALAAELVRLEPKVIVAAPTAAAKAVKVATSTIPIVIWGVPDPVGEGLIASFARPGGNVTGVTGVPPWESSAKQLQLLKEAVPRARRIAFLRDPTNPHSLPTVRIVTDAARALGAELQVFGARGPAEFEPAFRAMTQARVDALLIQLDPAFAAHLARLADLAIKHHLPTMCGAGYVTVGGLMSYSVTRVDALRQAAGYVDRLLRGASPAELPVEQPTKFEIGINLKTAKALGLIVPRSLLLQADQVIQ
jgi:putative ABC transport system substrate-binding protein